MSIPVLILGEPGSGKSYSLRNFKRGEIGVIQTIAKPLPFRADVDVAASLDIDTVAGWLKNATGKKAMVVDDFGYLITDLYMRYTHGKDKLRDQYEVYKIIGAKVYNLINDIMTDGQVDRIVYLMMHVERDAQGNIEPATIGKLLNEKVKLVGMFTIVLMAVSDGDNYQFITNGQPLKSPPGMFSLEIPNDLREVDAAIREYWNYPPLSGAPDPEKSTGRAVSKEKDSE